MTKAIKGTDGSMRVTIPSDLVPAYDIQEGDEIIFCVNGRGIQAEPGDLILKIDHRGGNRNGRLDNHN
ncbi:MAG: AbrB/MazE/SpoVT family DNA-binding domain-containing protein [ANME-2 cluster archaeon]|nr:AbrB/MazE/SpoVT family DNA-binding domain-containing protein [ANME-2 cluster archaeon]